MIKKVFLILLCSTLLLFSFTKKAKQVSIAQVYNKYFPIGAAINPVVDLASEERKDFIAYQYNSVTPENQMKPLQIHPKENKWNWEPADKIVRFAKDHNMKVRGHVLVWYQNSPDWLIKENGKLATKEQLYRRMKNHISTVLDHYKNSVYCWDVVNEAISDNPYEIFREKDSLYAIAGEEYVEMAFRFAREVDPKVQLFYNDYRFSDPVKREKIYNMLKRLKEKGVPIDGVGMQSHYIPNEVSEKYLQETIDMFSSLGLKIQITELDVSVYNYRDKKNADADKNDDKYTDERKKQQEGFYKMLFALYRKNKDKITGITFWGTSDMRKNYRTNRIGKMDYPFLFDEFMQPKPIFYAVTSFE